MSEHEREETPGGVGSTGRGRPRAGGSVSLGPTASGKFTESNLLLHCYKCQSKKPVSDFHRDAGRKSGYSSRCRPCNLKRLKERPRYHEQKAARGRAAYGRKRGRPRKARAEGHLCRGCGFVMAADAFWSDPSKADGIARKCKNCVTGFRKNSEVARETRRRHKRKYARRIHLRKSFGLSEETYEAMLAAQGGGCAICASPRGKRRLAVDHCHVTGKVRALLCHACNVGIGHFRDDPALVARALDYLRTHSPPSDVE
jgi:hypothetical protein